MRGYFGDAPTFKEHLAFPGEQARNSTQGRGFAGTIGADERHDLLGKDFKRDAFDGLDRPVVDPQITNRQNGRAHPTSSTPK